MNPETDDQMDYQGLYELARNNKREYLLQELKNQMTLNDFQKGESDRWDYCLVASYLEDGWGNCYPYWEFRNISQADVDKIGVILNRLVGGLRPGKNSAREANTKYVFDTDQGHAAAFLLSQVTKQPARRSQDAA